MDSDEQEMVRRWNLNTGLYHDMPLTEAMKEIASKTSVDTYNSRLKIVVRLCEGKSVEIGLLHRYTFAEGYSAPEE